MHTREISYQFEYLSIFTHISSQKINERIHKGEILYKLSQCDKYFVSTSRLLFHKRSNTGEKTYNRSSCDKCFKGITYLVHNYSTQTEGKPYNPVSRTKVLTLQVI